MNIKGVIFDFDGTLFDSMSIWERAGEDYLASLGIKAEENLSEKLKTMNLMQSAEYLKESYSLSTSTEEIVKGINKTIEDFYFFRALPKDNVLSYLEALKSKGIKMCIGTATDRYQVEEALKRCNMLGFFERIFTCTEVGYSKEEPHIFDCACNSMGFEKCETAVFEDAFHGVYTAKKAGYFTVGIYDKYEKRRDELKGMADLYYKDFAEALERGDLL